MPRQSSIVPEESMVVSYPHPHSHVTIHKMLSSNGDIRVNSRVDSMRASSPHNNTNVFAIHTSDSKNTRDDAYNVWLRKYPSALNNFERMMDASKGKRIVMFLDYDGTLSPIVADPDRAYMSDSMRAAVKEVAKLFPTAIVSGRGLNKVLNFVKLGELYYAGSHGMDIKGPSKKNKHNKAQAKSVLFQPASEFLPMIDELYIKLVDKMETIAGSKVENNKFCLSVHFRCVDEKNWSTLADQVKSVVKDYPRLHLTKGRKVFEIRPSIEWDKGKALEFLLESLGFSNCDNVFPVYLGDDRTDEDAFKVLRERKQGCGILVSKISKETSASYSLQEPTEVMEFLHQLVEWKRFPVKCRSKV